MNRKIGLPGILAAGIVAAIVLAACGPKTAALNIDMKDFMFEPDHWSVPAGVSVTLTLKNSGALDHTWIIMKKGVTASTPFGDADKANIFWQGDVSAGDSQTFTFDAPTEAGDYEVVCGEPAHLEQGMKGTLTVTP